MVVKNISLLPFLLLLFVSFALFRFFSHKPEAVEATITIKTEFRAEDLDDFLSAIVSVGSRVGLDQTKTISKNPKGIDVVTLQFKKDNTTVMLIFNSLVDSMFSIYIYGDEANAAAISENIERELGGRWHLVRKR